MILLLLSLILFYVHLVILNKVDLILTQTPVSIRCPDGKLSLISKIPASSNIDNIRSYCAQPYLLSPDKSINVFSTNVLLHKCTNVKALETKFKLHLTLIHKSSSTSPSSLSIHNENPAWIKQLNSESVFGKNYTVTIGENIKLITKDGIKFKYTFYIWFVKRDWIICRLDTQLDTHPCTHTIDYPEGTFNPFCYYNVNAVIPITIDELNKEYEQYLKTSFNKTPTKSSHSITNTKNKKTTLKTNLLKKQKKTPDKSSKSISNKLSMIIVISILCLLILLGLPLLIIYFYKRRKQNKIMISEQSSADTVITTVDDELTEGSVPSILDKKSNSLNIRSNMFDDFQ